MNLIIPSLFGMQANYRFMTAVFVLLFGFYVVTWDEYHTHTLYLTTISGPVEGTIIFTICSFISGHYGPQVWSLPISTILPFVGFPGNILLKDIVLLGIIVPGLGAIITSLRRVASKNSTAYKQLLPFILCSVCAGICYVAQPAVTQNMVIFLLILGFTFTNSVVSTLFHLLTDL